MQAMACSEEFIQSQDRQGGAEGLSDFVPKGQNFANEGELAKMRNMRLSAESLSR